MKSGKIVDYKSLPARTNKYAGSRYRTDPKKFMVDRFRLAYLTIDQSRALYNKIREDITLELLEGNRVSLFGIVMLEPADAKYRASGGNGKPIITELRRKIKAKIPSNYRDEWSKAYVQRSESTANKSE